jgi:hypothetical protein
MAAKADASDFARDDSKLTSGYQQRQAEKFTVLLLTFASAVSLVRVYSEDLSHRTIDHYLCPS